MGAELSRRTFLRGRFREPRPLRPPWAEEEKLFAARCDGCGECLRQCPEGILVARSDRTPEVDFTRGECTFCGACADHCTRSALARGGDSASAWSLKAVIGEGCLAKKGVVCQACGEQCEPRALRFRMGKGGRSLPHLDDSACTGCGACVAPCPVQAVTIEPQGQD